MIRVEELLAALKKEEKKQCDLVKTILAIVGVLVVIAGVAFAVYKFICKKHGCCDCDCDCDGECDCDCDCDGSCDCDDDNCIEIELVSPEEPTEEAAEEAEATVELVPEEAEN